MVTWREGVVLAVRSRRPGAVEYAVRLAPVASAPPAVVAAVGYADLVGEAGVGERVLLTTDALDEGLGTGGVAFVAALPDRVPAASEAAGETGEGWEAGTRGRTSAGGEAGAKGSRGRVVKVRYTPLQTLVPAVEDHDSLHHELLREADDLAGLPVVVADLHSALPAVLAALRQDAPSARVAYVMTDEAALPLAFSRAVAALREAGWLAGVVTTGQAFGGDLDSVTLHSGLLAARHVLSADAVVVAPGPGGVGTGTRWGFTGVAAGEAVNAVGTLGGRAVGALRVSGADPRERHRGLSHHSRTAYGRVALTSADLPVPVPPPASVDSDGGDGPAGADAAATCRLRELQPLLQRQVSDLVGGARARLTAYDVDVTGLVTALHAGPAPLSSMGRSLQEDPVAFLAAAAAGRHAATLLPCRVRRP